MLVFMSEVPARHLSGISLPLQRLYNSQRSVSPAQNQPLHAARRNKVRIDLSTCCEADCLYTSFAEFG